MVGRRKRCEDGAAMVSRVVPAGGGGGGGLSALGNLCQCLLEHKGRITMDRAKTGHNDVISTQRATQLTHVAISS